MSYLYMYLAIGIGFLLILLLMKPLGQKEPESEFLAAVKADLNRNKSLWNKLLDNLLIPAAGYIFVVVAWPIGMGLKVHWEWKTRFCKDKLPAADDIFAHGKSSGADLTIEEEPKFEVKHADLVKRLNRATIEELEKVHDPLAAVPEKPFGHLNSAWEAFLAKVPENGEFWTFDAVWNMDRWQREQRKGYAATAEGAVVAFMVTQIDVLDN